MALVAAVTEGLAVLTLVLAFVVNVGSPSAVLATFLVLIVLSLVCSAVAMILGVVGLVKYARYQWVFVLVIVASVVLNPLVWLGVLALFT